MFVSVMGIRKMRVLVHQSGVCVPVVMGLLSVPVRIMCVAMVCLMRVNVVVLDWLVGMGMLVALGEMKPDA